MRVAVDTVKWHVHADNPPGDIHGHRYRRGSTGSTMCDAAF